MENFSLFDIAVVVLILLLGLKGIFRGFIKESFSLIGLVGGIFVASRYGDMVGNTIDQSFYHFQNHSALSLVGFLVVLALFWLVAVFLGTLFSGFANSGSMSIIQQILGFVVGVVKVFLIFSIIFYILANIEIIKSNLEKYVSKSAIYPYFMKTGAYIVKIKPLKEEKEETKSTITKETKKESNSTQTADTHQ